MGKTSMRGIAITLAAVALLTGCSSKQEPRNEPPQPTSPQIERPQAGAQCGAHELAYLVGKSKSQIPVPVDPSRRRVACTTCPVTMDYNPTRLNIFFDAETGIIKEVKCG